MKGQHLEPDRSDRRCKRGIARPSARAARRAATLALAALLAVGLLPASALASPAETPAEGEPASVSEPAAATFASASEPAAATPASASEPAAEGAALQGEFGYRGFPDVADDAWFVREGWLDYALDQGLITGFAGGEFAGCYGGDMSVTRGMVATVLWRMAGEPSADAPDFSDVPRDQWYAPAVTWARATGVVTGDLGAAADANRFRPEDPISRQNLALMLARYASIEGVDTSTDRSAMNAIAGAEGVGEWAADGMGWAVDAGLVSGGAAPGGVPQLDPEGTATRAQFAKMATVLHRDVLGLGSTVEYADGVIVVASDAYTPTGAFSAALTSDAAEGIEPGDVVVLEPSDANPAGAAVKVGERAANADGTVSVSGTQPAFDEIVEELSIAGETTGVVSFEPAEGVSTLDRAEALAEFGDEALLFDETFSVGSLGTVGVGLSAEYAIGYRDGGFDRIDVSVTAEATFEWELSESISGAVRCGTATLATNVPGLLVRADLYMTYTLEGGIRLEAVATATAGVTYRDELPADGIAGTWGTTCEGDLSSELRLSARARGGVEPVITLGYLMFDLVDVSVDVGQEAAAEVVVRDTGMICTDMAIWVYADLSVGEHDSLAGMLGLSNTWQVLTRENNPTLIETHSENDVIVPECTWEDEPEPGPDPDPDPGDPTGPVEPTAFFAMLPDSFGRDDNVASVREDVLTIGDDGSLIGRYYEVEEHSPREFEDTGQYYTFTHSFGDASGTFANPTQLSEHAYEVELTDLDVVRRVGKGWLDGDTLYRENVYTALAIADEKPWIMFAPGTTPEELYAFGDFHPMFVDPETGELTVWMLWNRSGGVLYYALS